MGGGKLVNIFEYDFKIRKQSLEQGIELSEELEEEIKFKYKIYDHHFAYDLKAFIEFLKNKNNMIYFLARAKILSMLPSEIYLETTRDIIISLIKENEKINKNLYKLDKDAFIEILVFYFTYYAFNYDIKLSKYLEATKTYINIDEEEITSDLELLIEKKGDKLYEEYMKKKYIPTIIDALFPLEKKLNNNQKFDEETMIRNFYKSLTEASFEKGIEEFTESSQKLLSMLKSREMQEDFLEFSKEAMYIKAIKNLITLEDDISLLSKKHYKKKGEQYWVPLLRRSNINFNTSRPYALLLSKAILQYIVAYSIIKTIKKDDRQKQILAKNFEYISEFSPFLNYIKDLTKLDKSHFQFIFLKLLIDCCNASSDEIKLLINTFHAKEKRTFDKNENFLPIIKKMDCPILDIF